MKYDWENQPTEESPPPSAENEYTKGLLPNFCKRVGLTITFVPIVYKIMSLLWPSWFIHMWKIPDLLLLGVILAGLGIETMSRAKTENEKTERARLITLRILAVVTAIFFFKPFVDLVF